MFAFSLWREFKLSIAELLALLPDATIVFTDDTILVIDSVKEDQVRSVFSRLGGSIRLLRIEKEIASSAFAREAESLIRSRAEDKGSKFSFALASFAEKLPLGSLALKIKKSLRDADVSIRALNRDDRNINAAAFKHEKLSTTLGEIGLLKIHGKTYLSTTLLCQDVDAFAERDLGKGRDMQVGMLPPKLARMMANIAGVGQKLGVYDPFCGLWTVLIESADLGAKRVFGSDISPAMVETSENALRDFEKSSGLDFDFATKQLDARKVGENTSMLSGVAIVTEWYLGEVLGKHSVSVEKVEEQKRKLVPIYQDFFASLKKVDFRAPIVITIPFWDVGGKYVYFEEVHKIMQENGFISSFLLPRNMPFAATKHGTLLYRRAGQTVGREVAKIEKSQFVSKKS